MGRRYLNGTRRLNNAGTEVRAKIAQHQNQVPGGLLLANRIYHWDDAQGGRLSLEIIRTLHLPQAHYRVSYNRYDAGASFCGVAKARRFYIIDGACKISIGAEVWDLVAGHYTDLPEGRFQIRVPPSSGVEFVSVWELPEWLWAENSMKR